MLARRSALALLGVSALAGCSASEEVHPLVTLSPPSDGAWGQWGRLAGHEGAIAALAQAPKRALGAALMDPFVDREKAEDLGDLVIHYQSPLVEGDDVFVEVKGGRYTSCSPPGSGMPSPCGADAWGGQTWSEQKLTWSNGALVPAWTAPSDWTPPPDGGGLGGWEPVFHAALAGDYLVMPGARGTLLVVRRSDGVRVTRIDPFDDASDLRFVAGPITVSSKGELVYDVIELGSASDPWGTDVAGAWLVKVARDGSAKKASYASLVPHPPSTCRAGFRRADLPWPPKPDAKPGVIPCGAQRPPLNLAPAIGPDGTIYVASRTHIASRYGFLVAVNADLSPKWTATLRDHLADGCDVLVPPSGTPGGCRAGAAKGVDPSTNELPAGILTDDSTASPTLAPDGSIYLGVYTRYNEARGHLFHFGADGEFREAYPFGWDVTPAIWEHDGTYSVVIKDNHYDTGSYCSDPKICPPAPGGPYGITQLSPSLELEWSFASTNTKSCARDASGKVTCTSDHPNGFEWCINAPAIDRRGTVFANGEDGVLYAIEQGGRRADSIFLNLSIGAAYTPLAIDAKGRVYAENFGSMIVVGE